jgi:hypothetical protein
VNLGALDTNAHPRLPIMLRVSNGKSRGHGAAGEQTRIITVKPHPIVNPVAGSFGDILLKSKQLSLPLAYLRSAAAALPELQAYRTTR